MATQDATQTPTQTHRAAGKRKRKSAPVTTSARLQPRTLLASTRDELREIQANLVELADARRALLAKDKHGTKSSLKLLPPKA